MRRATRALWRVCGHPLVSIHARHATGDALPASRFSVILRFNSRPSCDGRPARLAAITGISNVSIPARHATGDRSDGRFARSCAFQFTPVMRRATSRRQRDGCGHQFQFTPVVRRATKKLGKYTSSRVSIHARRATGDRLTPRNTPEKMGFNSRPSCDGRRYAVSPGWRRRSFQFTPVVRRATRPRPATNSTIGFQFTPVVRRATRRLFPGVRRRSFNSRPSCDGRRDVCIAAEGV